LASLGMDGLDIGYLIWLGLLCSTLKAAGTNASRFYQSLRTIRTAQPLISRVLLGRSQ
jgi:hypothetical protein